ncbi:MAG: transglycosylase SLT domain-containing protein [Prolixibacteraceae bacterium]|jgi:membrane-bound lytic murein transglycosylase D|nr:transglycosylase SLT domain-containing protein [Prolixibacteraceae bacterium]MBT6005538.1 transglycosylase SLT domain-containing protein [Prolixibacteraceae bacterium]MBT6764202.1 transglycosylase SLT domain-containing protein [Prolixibacteraceae bacterium]MBT6999129.1 transglycosylase SLT domain-containing protein [Prolixibacteraceae bacterium]MBT7396083.1 transglycosylase SLT domain-containing protein [Prolixibacteraceae bacterium]
MRKTILTLATLFFFMLFTESVLGQEKDSLLTFQTDTILLLDSLKEPDALPISGEVFPNENLNEIFSGKLDSLVNTWFIENAFKPDSAEINFSKTFPKDLPDSVYIQRLRDTEQIIDLSFNNIVENYIKMYSEKRRSQVEMMLGLSAYYFPIFEETLDKYNMPLELKYLPIIESALNPKALSPVGANGLWQFMYGTGKGMKLEITSFVDERRDPMKSTDAAARYLKQLFETYGDWHLAIAAYNCGPGNVNRAIRRSGDKTNYWEIYYGLPRETRGYVPAFIAATYVMNYYKEHNLVPRFPEIPLFADTIMVNDYLHFDQIAGTINIDKNQLQALNPMYRRDIIPATDKKPYPLILPKEKIMEFIDNDKLIFAFERNKYFPNNTLVKPSESSSGYYTPADIKGKARILYTVKSGDNVGFVSSWFKVRSSDLKYWNNINRNLIRVGQKLAIYVPESQKEKYEKVNGMTFAQKQAMIGKSSTPTEKEKPKPLDPNFVYHEVKKGDTLWEIAQKYAGISSSEIMQLNKLENDRGLYIGQQLKIKRKS